MALKIRLKRLGAKRRPFYRVIVIDSRSPRQGRAVEEIGRYSAVVHEEDQIAIQLDRVDYWVSKGAQMTDTVRRLVLRVRRKENEK